ncbi:hypothetical protein [Hafnia paralvei]|uniref:hypothetical protein n=1 Tax=Hafnia paralvei TaxID=546367 RepID=UPI002FDC4559
MKGDNGGPAFPNVPDGAGDKWNDWDKGMSMRDYFAAKAMLAIGVTYHDDQHDEIATVSYKMADAMLKARDE